ncbi:hypothetical protein [Vulgatibacter incomptus]|uniref:Uncharacterized protein n=1 Tax=Vulgatibacter incomptus TaxID=1391653 RepID=A0A0K1PHB9_9BACT|nr:hypothetical protein [Vulgatibacter incomptus]AKU92791.1 hypothetical protein AKJ08_3178 [Vulgatibacter incomptus]
MLNNVIHGHLQAVRASHRVDHLRDPPGPREAILLEEAWGRHAPRVVVYDVDDPLGLAQPSDYEYVLHEIRSFHAGEKRPPDQAGGGLFWAAFAPG